jgi:hypothetical protein
MNNIKETMEGKKIGWLYDVSVTLNDRCIKSHERVLYNPEERLIKPFLLEQLRKCYDRKLRILEERVKKGLPLEDPPELLEMITPKSYILKDGELVPIPPREEE